MWKKPSIEMPDFKKANLVEMLEKDSLETNGGISTITAIRPYPFPIKFPGPIILSGMIAIDFDLGVK